MLAGQPVTLASIYRLLSSVSSKPEDVNDRDWRRESFVFEALIRADQTSGAHADLPAIRHFFYKEWPAVPPKTRATVEADLTGLLDPLMRQSPANPLWERLPQFYPPNNCSRSVRVPLYTATGGTFSRLLCGRSWL